MELTIIFGIVKAVAVLPAVFWLVGRFGQPVTYWRDESRGVDPDRMDRWVDRWKFNAMVFIVFVGLMVLAYDLCDSFLDWMPRSWGGVDEDGDWRPMRPGLQTMLAFLIAGSVMQIAENRAEAAAKWPIDHRFTLDLMCELEANPKRWGDVDVDRYRMNILAAGRRSLEKERYPESYHLRLYREDLAKRLSTVEQKILDAEPRLDRR